MSYSDVRLFLQRNINLAGGRGWNLRPRPLLL